MKVTVFVERESRERGGRRALFLQGSARRRRLSNYGRIDDARAIMERHCTRLLFYCDVWCPVVGL